MISSKQKPSQTWVSIKMWMGVALMLLGGAVVDQANGYCFEIGQNPSWTGPPHVQQIDLTTVLVSWEGLIQKIQCADQFVVKSGPIGAPSDFTLSPLLQTSVFTFIINDRTPEIKYFYQVIAREDKGWRGIEYNRSPQTVFATSRKKGNLRPDLIQRFDQSGPKQVQGPLGTGNAQPVLLDGQSKDSDNKEEDGGFVQNYLVWVVIGSLVALLVIVGIIYNMRRLNKGKIVDLELDSNNSYDDQEYDEDEEAWDAEFHEEGYDYDEEANEDGAESVHSVVHQSVKLRNAQESRSLKSGK